MESVNYKDFVHQKSNGNYDISCQTCEKKFPMVGILEIHLIEVHKAEPINTCDGCGTDFKKRIGRIFLFMLFLLSFN